MMLRCTWLVPPAIRPPGAASMPADVGAVEHGVGAGQVAAQHGHVEQHLGDAELHERRRRRRDRALPLRHRLERHAPHHLGGEALALDRAEVAALATARPSTRGGARARSTARADVAALAGEHGHADAPPAVERAEQVARPGARTSVKNTSSNSASPGHLPQRPDLDAGQVHRAQEERDALVLGGVGVGAGHEDAPVAVAAPAAPHLLTVDDEVVAVALGPRRQAAEVAARHRAR